MNTLKISWWYSKKILKRILQREVAPRAYNKNIYDFWNVRSTQGKEKERKGEEERERWRVSPIVFS